MSKCKHFGPSDGKFWFYFVYQIFQLLPKIFNYLTQIPWLGQIIPLILFSLLWLSITFLRTWYSSKNLEMWHMWLIIFHYNRLVLHNGCQHIVVWWFYDVTHVVNYLHTKLNLFYIRYDNICPLCRVKQPDWVNYFWHREHGYIFLHYGFVYD